ncbi:MAG: single-stranded DNA-binding protein [Chitinophagales bacterium]|nr:single-stranded DNA-binding protein [Chitinophagales bacterium]
MSTVRNYVQLTGNLGRNPEIINFENGRSLAKFSMATSENYLNKAGEKVQETQWHNVVAWGDLVKTVEEQLEKGKEVVIKGKIAYREYENKNGGKRYITEIVAKEIELVKRPSTTEIVEAS